MFRGLLLFLLLVPFTASAEEFVAGKDYEVIHKSAGADADTKKVNVTEFFNYGCPWCYRIEPALTEWVNQQGDKIQFTRVPVIFNKDWAYYAKAYYAANLLGLDSKFNPLLFKAIQDKKAVLNNNDAMIAFFTEQGVDKSTAESAFKNSTTVDMQVNQGTAKMAQYHVNAVPAIVIDGQYKTDLQMAQNEKRLFEILSYLIDKSHPKKS